MGTQDPQDATSVFIPARPDSTGAVVDTTQAEFLQAITTVDFWSRFASTGLRIMLILALAWITTLVAKRLARRWRVTVADLPAYDAKRQRTLTLSNLLLSTVRYAVWMVAIIMALSELDLNIGPLLASAGIAGLAIGFGAQTLVKDVISGFFLLFDDTIQVGHQITFGDQSGVVEYLGLRLIKVRKFNGDLLMVPAGELRTFANRSIDYARVVVDVGMSYESNTDDVLEVIRDVASAWTAEHQEVLLEPEPMVLAITDFGESSVQARIAVKAIPGQQYNIERDLRMRLKRAFDTRGIPFPYPTRTVYNVWPASQGPPDLGQAGSPHEVD
jgi:small conductance mechanosensitive channel